MSGDGIRREVTREYISRERSAHLLPGQHSCKTSTSGPSTAQISDFCLRSTPCKAKWSPSLLSTFVMLCLPPNW